MIRRQSKVLEDVSFRPDHVGEKARIYLGLSDYSLASHRW